MSTFDIKQFLINEGLTRVSRDRKRLLKEAYHPGSDDGMVVPIAKSAAGLGFFYILASKQPADVVNREWKGEYLAIPANRGWNPEALGELLVPESELDEYITYVEDPEEFEADSGLELTPKDMEWDYEYFSTGDFPDWNPRSDDDRELDEGMTRVSRDRKRLLKEGTEDQNLFFKKWLDLIKDPKNSELGQIESVPEDLKDWAEDMEYEQWIDSERNVAGGTTIMVDKEEVHSPEELIGKFKPGKYIVVDNDFLYYVGDELGMSEDEFEEMIDNLDSHELWVETPVSVAGVDHFFRIPDNL